MCLWHVKWQLYIFLSVSLWHAFTVQLYLFYPQSINEVQIKLTLEQATKTHRGRRFIYCVRNVVAHGDAREGKWRGNWRMEWVASTLTRPRNVVYPALLTLMRTPRLPAVDWTDAPADLNGLVRLGERRNVVSARVSSGSARATAIVDATRQFFTFCWPCISKQIFANNLLDALFHVFIYLFHLSTCFEHHSAHHQEIELY